MSSETAPKPVVIQELGQDHAAAFTWDQIDAHLLHAEAGNELDPSLKELIVHIGSLVVQETVGSKNVGGAEIPGYTVTKLEYTAPHDKKPEGEKVSLALNNELGGRLKLFADTHKSTETKPDTDAVERTPLTDKNMYDMTRLGEPKFVKKPMTEAQQDAMTRLGAPVEKTPEEIAKIAEEQARLKAIADVDVSEYVKKNLEKTRLEYLAALSESVHSTKRRGDRRRAKRIQEAKVAYDNQYRSIVSVMDARYKLAGASEEEMTALNTLGADKERTILTGSLLEKDRSINLKTESPITAGGGKKSTEPTKPVDTTEHKPIRTPRLTQEDLDELWKGIKKPARVKTEASEPEAAEPVSADPKIAEKVDSTVTPAEAVELSEADIKAQEMLDRIHELIPTLDEEQLVRLQIQLIGRYPQAAQQVELALKTRRNGEAVPVEVIANTDDSKDDDDNIPPPPPPAPKSEKPRLKRRLGERRDDRRARRERSLGSTESINEARRRAARHIGSVGIIGF